MLDSDAGPHLGAAAADPDAHGAGGDRLPDQHRRPAPAARPGVPRHGRRGHSRLGQAALPAGQDDQPTGTFTFSDVLARELVIEEPASAVSPHLADHTPALITRQRLLARPENPAAPAGPGSVPTAGGSSMPSACSGTVIEPSCSSAASTSSFQVIADRSPSASAATAGAAARLEADAAQESAGTIQPAGPGCASPNTSTALTPRLVRPSRRPGRAGGQAPAQIRHHLKHGQQHRVGADRARRQLGGARNAKGGA